MTDQDPDKKPLPDDGPEGPDLDATIFEEDIGEDVTIVPTSTDARTIVEKPIDHGGQNPQGPVSPYGEDEDFDPNAETMVQTPAHLDNKADADNMADMPTEAMDFSDGKVTRRNMGATVPYGSAAGIDNAPELDGFQIVDKLGEGGMGVVWKAIQLSTNREVALKLLPPSALGSEKAQIRFQREVETAAKVEHLYIASIYESGIDKGIYFYAMQTIDGEELHDHVNNKNLGEKDILILMKKVCDGVHYAHLNGIIHRDLKPGNVLVTRNEGDPKILDFGLAKNFTDMDDSVSLAGEVMGTPMYMSTEQAQGNVDTIDGRTDVYSLGVMLYELLTKKFPYDTAGGPIEIIRRKFKVPPTRPTTYEPKMDLDLEAIILKAIEPQTGLRYSDADQMSKDIENYLHKRPVIARRHTKGYIFSKWLVRNRLGIMAGIAVAVLAGVVFGAAKFGSKEEVSKSREAVANAEKEKEVLSTQVETERAEQLSLLTDGLKTTATEIENGSTAAAQTSLASARKILENNKDETDFAAFSGEISTLENALEELKARQAARMSGVEKAGQAFADLAQNQVNNPSDLSDNLLQQLGFVYQEYKDSGYLDDPDVQDRKEQVAQKVLVLARTQIESRIDLDQRTQRLSAMKKFASDPRFKALFTPAAETLGSEIGEAEKLHVFSLVNRAPSAITVTQTSNGESFDLPPNAEQVLALNHADATAFAFTSVRLNDEQKLDPYYLPLPVAITPTAAGGTIMPVQGFTAKTIPVIFAAEGITATYSSKEKGPFQAMAADLQLVPGEYYVKFERNDHLPVVRPFMVQIEQAQTIIPAPASDAWQMRGYLAEFAGAKALTTSRKFVEALAQAKAIDQSSIPSEETRNEVNSFIRELEAHPVIVLGNQLVPAKQELDEFILSYVQLHDPINTAWGKTFRYQNGSLTVPGYKLPPIAEGELGLLDPADANMYRYLQAWAPLFPMEQTAGESKRTEVIQALTQFKSSHPTVFSAEVNAALSIFKGKSKDGPAAMNLTVGYEQSWRAHSLFKKDKVAGEKTLQALLAYINAGGQPNTYDVSLAIYSAYYPVSETAMMFKEKGFTPGANQFPEEFKLGVSIGDMLEAIIKAAPTPDVSAALDRMMSNPKNPEDLSRLMTYVLSVKNIGDEKRTLAEQLHDQTMQQPGLKKSEARQLLSSAKYFL